MTTYVRNPRGVIHAVPADRLADHLRHNGMSRATLEDWLAQEQGLSPDEPTKLDPTVEEVPRGVRRKRTKPE